MTGFWIFLIVITVCITIVICTFLKNEGIAKWDMRSNLRNIECRLSRIDEKLEGMYSAKGEKE